MIAKDAEGPRRTVRIPKRKSLGPLQIPLSSFTTDCDKQSAKKVAVLEVQSSRNQTVLQKLTKCKMNKKDKEVTLLNPSDNISVTASTSEKGSHSKSDGRSTHSKSHGNGSHSKSHCKSEGKGLRSNSVGKSTLSKGGKSTRTKSSKDEQLKPETGNDSTELKSDGENSESKPDGTHDKSKSLHKDGMKLDFFSKSLSGDTSTPKQKTVEVTREYESDKAALLLLVSKLEAENAALKKQQAEQQSMMVQMNNNIQNLCNALAKKGNDNNKDGGTKDSSDSKSCKISLASNVTEEDGVEVPPEKIYIGKGNFIKKSELCSVDKKKPRNFKTRMEGVVSLVWPEGIYKEFNLAGSDSKKQVEEYHINAVHRLMNLLSWKNITLKPLKINQKMIEPLTYEHVTRKLGIYLSEIHKKSPKDGDEREDVGVKGRKKVGQKKRRKTMGSTDEESESDEGVKGRGEAGQKKRSKKTGSTDESESDDGLNGREKGGQRKSSKQAKINQSDFDADKIEVSNVLNEQKEQSDHY